MCANSSSNLNSYERRLLLEGLDDYVGLWEFAQILRSGDANKNIQQIRVEALAMVTHLVTLGYMKAGKMTPNGGFLSWGFSPPQTTERISQEWAELGHEPTIGDICAFSNTSLGDQVAATL